MNAMLIVEAALFSASEPVAVQDICDKTGLTREAVVKGLEELAQEMATRRSAVQLTRAGAKYALSVKAEFTESIRTVAPPEIPQRTLRTLAVIAYHQPITMARLKALMGPRVYDHVPFLVDAGLVHRSPEGNTSTLTTTPRFPEYFGIPATDVAAIRERLAEKLGIKRQQEEAAAAAAAEAALAGAPADAPPAGEAGPAGSAESAESGDGEAPKRGGPEAGRAAEAMPTPSA